MDEELTSNRFKGGLSIGYGLRPCLAPEHIPRLTGSPVLMHCGTMYYTTWTLPSHVVQGICMMADQIGLLNTAGMLHIWHSSC
jgi:hypothetical protein